MDKVTVVNSDLISAQVKQDIAGQLSPRSRRIYENDTKAFATWILGQGLTPAQLTRSDMIAYREYLDTTTYTVLSKKTGKLIKTGKYSKPVKQRMFSVANRILEESVHNNILYSNPATGLKNFRVEEETTHTALTKRQAEELIKSIDITSVKGMRDYAILMLLVYTGIRRSECVALNIEDIKQDQGHTIIVIKHGKGDKRGIVKLPVKVNRAIEGYLAAAQRQNATPESPLFVRFNKGDKASEKRLTDKAIELFVKAYGAMIGVPELTPHGLRATFITLSLEEGAKLHQVQYAARHKDPRTTERYQKRKINLDDNAVDYIRLNI